jgi:hypothetical protein
MLGVIRSAAFLTRSTPCAAGLLLSKLRRSDLIAQGENGEDRLDTSGYAGQMPCCGLCYADSNSSLAFEDRFDGFQLGNIADRRGCRIGVEMPHFIGPEVALPECCLHRAPSAVVRLRDPP